MDSLRLPPLRFTQAESTRSLNCVLPPITPPPRISPVSSTWHNSTPVPSPPAARHSPEISNLTHPTPDPQSSPIPHPPSSIAPLPSSSVLRTAGALHPYPNNAFNTSSRVNTDPERANRHDIYQHPTNAPDNHPLPYKTQLAPAPSHQPMPWQYPPPANPQHPAPIHRSNSYVTITANTYNSNQQSASIARDPAIAHPRSQSVELNPTTPAYYQIPTAKSQPVNSDVMFPRVPSTAGPSQRPGQAKSPLKRTMNTSRGLRDMYACPYPNCPRVSTEQSNMKAHMRMHTGEKPYICRHAGCMKAFRWKSSLTYHEKALHVKARPFKCTPCRRSFVEKRKLRMHYDLCPMVKVKKEEEEEGRRQANG